MEVATFRIGLFVSIGISVLMLNTNIYQSEAKKHDSEAGLAWIVPTRLQLFDYGSVIFNCRSSNSSTGWKVFRRIRGEVSVCISNWETTTPSVCAIKPIYPSDSGEYWCESGDGTRSNTLNITVTAGIVILESPVLPVVEGEAVTLQCRSKKTSIAHIADFYKDGVIVGTGAFGEMTIKRVLKSDEGLYKCSIFEFGESPESWLAVRESGTVEVVRGETSASPDHSCHIYLILRTVFTIVMVALLMMLVGLLHCGKLRVNKNKGK